MKVINKTENKISMQYLGKVYVIEANDCLEGVETAVAEHWKTKVHEFVVIEAEGSAKVAKPEVKEVEEKKTKK